MVKFDSLTVFRIFARVFRASVLSGDLDNIRALITVSRCSSFCECNAGDYMGVKLSWSRRAVKISRVFS